MWCQDTLNEGHDVGTVEDIELGSVLGEDLRESKLLHGASPVVWGIQGDVGRRCRRSVGWRRLDSDESLSRCRTSLRRSQAQIDLKKIVGFLGRGGPHGRVVHDRCEDSRCAGG